jgi:lipocalin
MLLILQFSSFLATSIVLFTPNTSPPPAVTFQNSCSDVSSEMVSRASGENGWTDPHNGGVYSFTSSSPSDITGTRTTGDGKYTDKYDFHFEETSASTCTVSACSESQVMSVLDYSTNYCNLHSLYCNSSEGCPTAGKDLTYSEKYSSCSQHDNVCVASKQTEKSLRGTTECPPVKTVDNFDLDSYINGKWYIQEQAETKYLPKDQNFCVQAEYTKKSSPTWLGWSIDVLNYAQEADGTPHSSGDTLCAKGADKNDPAKLEVAPCFLPSFLAGPYWVLEYNEAEGYALISGGQPTEETENGCVNGSGTNDSGLWIFTRSQKRDEVLVERIRDMAKAQGFDITVLNKVDQTNCNGVEETVSLA